MNFSDLQHKLYNQILFASKTCIDDVGTLCRSPNSEAWGCKLHFTRVQTTAGVITIGDFHHWWQPKKTARVYLKCVTERDIIYHRNLMLFSTAVWAESTILQIQRCDYCDFHGCEQVSHMKHERKVVGKLFAHANHSLQNYFGLWLWRMKKLF